MMKQMHMQGTSSMASKDQRSIDINESPVEKYNRGLDIFIESVQKPDHALRACAHNQKCYHELLQVREEVLDYLKSKRKDIHCFIDDKEVDCETWGSSNDGIDMPPEACGPGSPLMNNWDI